MISATPGREVRQELYLTPNMKKPDRMSGFFITWSVKPWGSAQGYKRPPQGVNEVIVVAQYIA